MCRDNSHGGRRCPHDTSEARRLRRHNAAAKTAFAGETHALFAAGENVETKPSEPEQITIGSIRKEIAELDSLKLQLTTLNKASYQELSLKTVIGGVETVYEHRSDVAKALLEAQEAQVVAIGSQVEALANERTGISETAINDYVLKRAAELVVEIEVEEAADNYIEKFAAANASVTTLGEEFKIKYESIMTPTMTTGSLIYKLRSERKLNPEYESSMKQYDEKTNELLELKSKHEEKLAPLKLEARELLSTGMSHQVVSEMMKKKADSYKEVIGELRPLGGELKVLDTSHPAKLKVLNSVLEIYPSDWIKASNEGNDLRIKTTAGRAHYSSARSQEVSKNEIRRHQVLKPNDWQPDLTNPEEVGWEKMDENNEWVNENGVRHSAHFGNNEFKTVWMAPSYQKYSPYSGFKSKNGVPTGPGWVPIETNNYVKQADGSYGYEKGPGYHRPVVRRRVVESTVTAEITIGGSDSSLYPGAKGHATAIHEFAHRVEGTGPKFISQMEEQFLKRRTTDAAGNREDLVRLYVGKKEFSRPDNFPHAYMGKIYNDLHREVLSMGAEAIFAGRHGGLQGASGMKADPDMRKFILGLFAAA